MTLKKSVKVKEYYYLHTIPWQKYKSIKARLYSLMLAHTVEHITTFNICDHKK